MTKKAMKKMSASEGKILLIGYTFMSIGFLGMVFLAKSDPASVESIIQILSNMIGAGFLISAWVIIGKINWENVFG